MPNIRIADMAPTRHGGKSKTLRIIYNSKLQDNGFEYWQEQMKIANSFGHDYEMQKIPCGICATCRMDQSKEWAIRCMMEASKYEHNWFITLTYDDQHKPRNEQMTTSQGITYEDHQKYDWNGYLEKEHISIFMKRLREHWSRKYNHVGIRFFAVGEYGGKTQRPHYHAILFNLPIPMEELKLIKITPNGDCLYTHPLIEEIWENGLISLGAVTIESAAYVARYSLKKITGKLSEDYYAQRGQTPEFSLMSRRPGIARDYYELKKTEMYKNDEIQIGKIKSHPPKYFDKLYDIDYPSDMERIRKTRKASAERAERLKMSKTTKTIKEQTWLDGKSKLSKIEQMKRDEI